MFYHSKGKMFIYTQVEVYNWYSVVHKINLLYKWSYSTDCDVIWVDVETRELRVNALKCIKLPMECGASTADSTKIFVSMNQLPSLDRLAKYREENVLYITWYIVFTQGS